MPILNATTNAWSKKILSMFKKCWKEVKVTPNRNDKGEYKKFLKNC